MNIIEKENGNTKDTRLASFGTFGYLILFVLGQRLSAFGYPFFRMFELIFWCLRWKCHFSADARRVLLLRRYEQGNDGLGSIWFLIF